MAKLNWTDEARYWLREIHDYIAEDNPQAAQQIVAGIYDRSQVLLEHPEIGQAYEGSGLDIRVLLFRHFRIAYLIRSDMEIDILGVFHGSMDFKRYLQRTGRQSKP